MVNEQTVRRLKDIAFEQRVKLLKLCGDYNGAVHIGGDMSMSDILAVLFNYAMNVDPKRENDPGRDRFILSKGHGAVGMYVAMALRGFFDYNRLAKEYNQLDSAFGTHPCKIQLPGVETSSGSLGQGMAIADGMALMARYRNEKHRVFCLLGDGETCEGEVWESAMLAGSYKLGNLIAVIDRNRQFMTAYSDEEYMHLEPYADKWRSFGWNVIETDGHDISALVNAFDSLPASHTDVPSAVICKTVKGKGVSFMERNISWHAGSMTAEQAAQAIRDLEAAREGWL
jgi:transketolase